MIYKAPHHVWTNRLCVITRDAQKNRLRLTDALQSVGNSNVQYFLFSECSIHKCYHAAIKSVVRELLQWEENYACHF